MTETLAARAVEAKFVADGDGIFAGYAAVFGTEPDAQGDVIAPGAFARSLAEHKAAGTWPLMLWQHDITEPIGVWLDLREDSAGLAVKGKLVLDAARGREAHALLKARALDGLSIGYRVRGFTRRPGGRLLSDLELIEISLVSLPAGARARITDVKSAASAVQPQEKTMDDEDGKGVGGTAEAAIEARIVALEASVAGIDTGLPAPKKRSARSSLPPSGSRRG